MAILTPEKAGVSSRDILSYIDTLEAHGLSPHALILAKGDDIFYQGSWAPFTLDEPHRLYSVTKSIVSIAVGFACQDGLLSLEDPMEKCFPEELKAQKNPLIKKQTVRDMLMMATTRTAKYWFTEHCADRVKLYFEDIDDAPAHPSGTFFEYDSCGSFVLGALVERVTGKTLLAYLREKLFDKIGVAQSARFLTCPGGHTWGDSAGLFSAKDLLRIARFVLNGGSWHGEQLLNREYVQAATSNLIATDLNGVTGCSGQGYGYHIWRTYDNSFFFNGMGCQFAVCVPDKDLILIHFADNQGKDGAGELVIGQFFEQIARKCAQNALPEDPKAYAQLCEKTAGLKLATARGAMTSPWQARVNGVTYLADENPMGITKFKLTFGENGGVFAYTNAQGDKELPFGLGENAFGYFPQTGYSDLVGSQSAPGHRYRCAASAAWVMPNQLFIKVQVIDAYLGTLDISIAFNGDGFGLHMQKSAEDFLNEYVGSAGGFAQKA